MNRQTASFLTDLLELQLISELIICKNKINVVSEIQKVQGQQWHLQYTAQHHLLSKYFYCKCQNNKSQCFLGSKENNQFL